MRDHFFQEEYIKALTMNSTRLVEEYVGEAMKKRGVERGTIQLKPALSTPNT